MVDSAERPRIPPSGDEYARHEDKISSYLSKCLESLEKLLHGVDRASKDNTSPSLQENWRTELGRLRIWSYSAQINRPTESSLDNSLRYSSHIRNLVLRVFEELDELLTESCEQETTEASSEDSDASDVDENTSKLSSDHNADTTFLHYQIQCRVDTLFELLVVIQRPTEIDLWTKMSEESSLWRCARLSTYIENLMPKGASTLIRARLATSLAFRLALNRDLRLQNIADALEFIGEIPTFELHTSEFAESMESRQPSSTTWGEYLLENTIFDTSRAQYLIIPTLSRLATVYRCPCCFSRIKVDGLRSLSVHLFEDVKPYICLLTGCPAPQASFTTSTAWIAHMQSGHGDEWRNVRQRSECIICLQQLKNSDDMIYHLEDHMIEFSLEQFFPSSIRNGSGSSKHGSQ